MELLDAGVLVVLATSLAEGGAEGGKGARGTKRERQVGGGARGRGREEWVGAKGGGGRPGIMDSQGTLVIVMHAAHAPPYLDQQGRGEQLVQQARVKDEVGGGAWCVWRRGAGESEMRTEVGPGGGGRKRGPVNPIGVGPVNPLGVGPVNPIGVGPVNPIGVGPVNPIGVGPVNPIGVGPDGCEP